MDDPINSLPPETDAVTSEPPYKPLVSRRYTGSELLNPNRPWVPSHLTDVAATFARIRAAQAADNDGTR